MDKPTPYCNPEIWGGIECTINRVGDVYIDQLHQSGHYYRDGDLELICSTGIRKMRYPVLWEKHQPEATTDIDFSWTAKQLEILNSKNIDVIAGLLHHGSGPVFTSLEDENFPYLLAEYAAKVAQQFPWIKYYTPVNEPLTTARFAGLYGIWYPHQRNDYSFLKMLLNELKGTVLAMAAIRKINPAAQLVQTEDLGKTYSTPLLQYQADFENERRWLTFDILSGKLDQQHPLWNFCIDAGIPEAELDFFINNPCVPEIFGFNHYLTSERYLDENLDNYPENTHGGNGRHRFADVEAVRVSVNEETGLKVLLKEAWLRYQQPMAITEVHLHCHREEQLRWFKYVSQIVNSLANEGIDIRGITTWAMLGSYGWNRLLTEPDGDYEPGLFDLRGGSPRPTALCSYIRSVTSQGSHDHHLSEERGWWQRETRLIYEVCNNTFQMTSTNTAPLMIIGKNGTLGRAFAKICEERCLHYVLLGRQDCDISSESSIAQAINQYKPWAVINAAGYVRVDDAEQDCDACMRDNTTGPQNLARVCNKLGVQLISFSSDLVFDGNKPTPYLETDLPNPLNVYGKSKAQSELIVQKEYPAALVIRTSAFFGPWDDYNFLHYIRKSLSQCETVQVAKDLYISPTYVPHLVHAALDLLIDQESGIWHLANKGAVTWSELAYMAAARFNLDSSLLQPVHASRMNFTAKRPYYSVLGSERGQLLPSLEHALDEYWRLGKAAHRKVA